jgi:hypothetical protein
MADKKISALTASTTPLAGTEVLPIVQSGATVKVSVANLTAGRAVGATSIQFGSGTVLSSYEEGTWTPVPAASVGSITTYTSSGSYVKVGKLVTCIALIDITNFGTASGDLIVNGLPFTSQNTTEYAPVFIRETFATGIACTGRLVFNSTSVTRIYKYDGTSIINVIYPREIFLLNISYISA